MSKWSHPYTFIFALGINLVIFAANTPVSVKFKGLGEAMTGNAFSSGPIWSADGRYVVFTSVASDLASNDLNGIKLDVYIRDLSNRTTRLVSATSTGASGNDSSVGWSISHDNRWIA